MILNRIGTAPERAGVPQGTRVPGPAQEPQPQPQPAGVAPAATAAEARAVERPKGVDPELWSVLSASERAYLSKIGAMGPLTYGALVNRTEPAQMLARGGRLNVVA